MEAQRYGKNIPFTEKELSVNKKIVAPEKGTAINPPNYLQAKTDFEYKDMREAAKAKSVSKKAVNGEAPIYKLAQLGTAKQINGSLSTNSEKNGEKSTSTLFELFGGAEKPLWKRAKSKFFTLDSVWKLVKLSKEQLADEKKWDDKRKHGKKCNCDLCKAKKMKAYYTNATYCASTLTQTGDKITGEYCKTRVCLVCNRIRMAQLIDGYGPAIEAMKEPRFLTLTRQNVTALELPYTIKEMNEVFTEIITRFRKKSTKTKKAIDKVWGTGGVPWYWDEAKQDWCKQPEKINWQTAEASKQSVYEFNGLRKIEVTHNEQKFSKWFDTFHPHFHIIVDGQKQAEMILKAWRDYYGDVLTNKGGQDIRPIDEGSLIELFKYSFKIVCESTDTKIVDIHYKAVDVIMRALYRKRTIQPFGKVVMVSEEVDEMQSDDLTAQGYEGVPYYVRMKWQWEKYDWFNVYKEALSGFTPEKEEEKQKVKKSKKVKSVNKKGVIN